MATPNHLSTSQFNYFNSFTYWSSIVRLCLKGVLYTKKEKVLIPLRVFLTPVRYAFLIILFGPHAESKHRTHKTLLKTVKLILVNVEN